MLDWLEDFREGHFLIHCTTQQEAYELFNILRENGFTWCSGETLEDTSTRWENHGDATCYNGEVRYGDIEYHKDEGDTIVDFCDLTLSETEIEVASNEALHAFLFCRHKNLI